LRTWITNYLFGYMVVTFAFAAALLQRAPTGSDLILEGSPGSDTVYAALLSLGSLNTAQRFSQARHILRTVGPALLGRQLYLDGFVELGTPSNLHNNLIISLAEGSPLTRVARLAAGVAEHTADMKKEQLTLGEHRSGFVVALPGAGDPFDANPPRNHRIIAARDACPWMSFDILSLGLYDGEIEQALRHIESLLTVAQTYANASGWAQLAVFLRCYPRCEANVPHIHIIDLGAAGSTSVTFGPWDLPLGSAISALQEELGRSALPSALQMQQPNFGPQGSQGCEWVEDAPIAVPQHVVELASADMAAQENLSQKEQDESQMEHPFSQRYDGKQERNNEHDYWWVCDNGHLKHLVSPPPGSNKAESIAQCSPRLETCNDKLSTTADQLEQAMQEVRLKMARVRSTTLHTVDMLGRFGCHGLGTLATQCQD
jgi:hypothetical protein